MAKTDSTVTVNPLPVETRRKAFEGDSKWPLKATLRVVATGISFLGMILFAAAISLTNKNFVNTDGDGDWTDGLALAPILLSILYNPLALIGHFIFRKGKHFHPAWHIVGDFVIWGLCVPSIVFTVAGGLFMYWMPAIADQNGNVDCGFFFNEWSPQCDPVAYTIGHLEIAGIVFLFITFIIHFALFVFACLDTHQWRMMSKMTNIEKGSFEMPYSNDPEQ